MLKINIHEEVRNAEEMADILEKIASMLREGFTSGHYPAWGTEKQNEHTNP